jgi:hypothetical protein
MTALQGTAVVVLFKASFSIGEVCRVLRLGDPAVEAAIREALG